MAHMAPFLTCSQRLAASVVYSVASTNPVSCRVCEFTRACVSQVGDPVTNMPFGDTEANLLSAIGDV